MVEYLPIKFDTVKTGSPYKVMITKLPKLFEDRQNLIKRLTEAGKAIGETNTMEPDNEPAAKKKKAQ